MMFVFFRLTTDPVISCPWTGGSLCVDHATQAVLKGEKCTVILLFTYTFIQSTHNLFCLTDRRRNTISVWFLLSSLKLYENLEKSSGFMVSPFDSRSSVPGSNPGQGHCVVLLGKIGVEMGTVEWTF